VAWWPAGGGLFSRLIVVSVRGLPDRFSRWRAPTRLRFAAGCGLAVAVIGLATRAPRPVPATHDPRPARRPGRAAGRLHAAEVLRHLDLGLVGVPAGVFAPSLAIGAGIGHDVALLMGVAPRPPSR
jgi:H+/Cl- antiporter ClcA